MKIIVAGTRYKDKENKIPFDDYSIVTEAITNSHFPITELISGRAIGVDQLGEKYAQRNNIPIKEMPVSPKEWSTLGRKAGPMRNKRMAEYCDAAVIIWDGVSPGTKNMINEMNLLMKPYYLRMSYNNVEDFM